MNKKLPKKKQKTKAKKKNNYKKKAKNPSIKIYDIINKKKKKIKERLPLLYCRYYTPAGFWA